MIPRITFDHVVVGKKRWRRFFMRILADALSERPYLTDTTLMKLGRAPYDKLKTSPFNESAT
jgi:hypothetical protein